MTPTELHSRILLHELRTILLDETREGEPIPQEWREQLTTDPHNPANYLVLADWLDDQGDPLGELCRIQVELIGQLYQGETYMLTGSRFHPFRFDLNLYTTTSKYGEGWPIEEYPKALAKTKPQIELLSRRWEITQELYTEYPEIPKTEDSPIFRPRILRQSRLGRTTRMLTDILRYCYAKRDGMVLVLHDQPSQTQSRFLELFQELHGTPHNGPNTSNIIVIYKNGIRFREAHRGYDGRADITFTDHACQGTNWDRISTLTPEQIQEFVRIFKPVLQYNPPH